MSLSRPTARVGAIEDRQMFTLQVRRTFDRHCSAAIKIGKLDVGALETYFFEEIEARLIKFLRINSKGVGAEFCPERPLVEGELNVECATESVFEFLQRFFCESPGRQAFVIDCGCVPKRSKANRIVDDVIDSIIVVAQGPKCLLDGLVDDLEISATGKFLKFY